VSAEQRENLEAVLRRSAFPVDSDVSEQRRLLRELTSAQQLPADVSVTEAELGGVPTAEITIDGVESRHVVLYFHGGVYVLGDAFQAADVGVTLDITPSVPHVFQNFFPILDEAAAALDRAGRLLSAKLADAERVTA
jgi:hypothetical protein